jgi:hypothetical protein
MFDKKFADGLSNIKFFISPNQHASADEIRADAIAFQTAIDAGHAKEVSSVD